jgi:hypothetical protein
MIMQHSFLGGRESIYYIGRNYIAASAAKNRTCFSFYSAHAFTFTPSVSLTLTDS